MDSARQTFLNSLIIGSLVQVVVVGKSIVFVGKVKRITGSGKFRVEYVSGEKGYAATFTNTRIFDRKVFFTGHFNLEIMPLPT